MRASLLRSILLLVAAGVPCLAQLDRGTLTGIVSDTSGAVIPGAKVTITNTDTKATYRTGTTGTGQYNMPALPAGTYTITFQAPSFKALVRNHIEVRSTNTVRVDAVMELGDVKETMQVSDAPARIETETPQVTAGFSGKNLLTTVVPIPYGGRVVDNLPPKIMPGVSGDSWQMRINGSTDFSKEALLEGASTATYLSGAIGESAPSMEALEELKVQMSGTSAEYGRTQGAVFNYTMKGGTNQFHGSAYGALKNEALNSNGFANNYRGVKRQYQRMDNWAAALGGPAVLPKLYDGHNKTFFFAAYERYFERDNRMGSPTTTWPVPEFYQGDFSRLLGPNTGLKDALGRDVIQGAIYDPATFRLLDNGRWVGDMFPGNRIPTSRISKVSTRLNDIASKNYTPQVKDASGQYPLQNNAYSRASSQPSFDQYNFSIKVEHNVTEAHKLSGVYNYTARPRVTVGGMWREGLEQGGPLASGQIQDLVSNVARLSHTWIVSPRILNHMTLSYNRLYNPSRGLWANIDGAAELGIGNLHTTGYPEVTWGGGPYVSLTNPGSTRNNLQAYIGMGFLDTVSFSRGRHFMKAGVDLRHNHENSRPGQAVSFSFSPIETSIPGETFAGTRTGYAFASYLLGNVYSGSVTDPVGIGDRVSYTALFFQDDFKVNSRLTLQLGLRWEYQPPATEVGNRLSSFNPDKVDPVSGLKGAYDFAGECAKCTGRNYFGRKSWRDFGPRVGLAYRLSNRFSIRAAYGILYEANLFNYYDGTGTPLNKATSTAWGGTYNMTADSVFPAGGLFNWDNGFPSNRYIPVAMDPSWGNTSRPGMIDPQYGQTPYVQQWNFNVQHEIFRKTVIDVGYLGNKGTRLHNGLLKALNQIDPKLLSTFGRTLTSAVTNEAQAQSYGIAYPYPGFRGTVASALRPFPQVAANNTIQVYGTPLGFSTYHSMQVTVSRQVNNGLSVYSNYVWAKTLTNTISSMASNNSAPLDYYNLRNEKMLHEGDCPQALKVSFFYDLPFGKHPGGSFAHRALNQVIGGWNISGVLNYIRGTPVALSANSPLSNAWNGGGNRPNVLPGPLTVDNYNKKGFDIANPSSSANTFFIKSQFSSPAALTLGSGAKRYAQLRQMGTINEDLVLRKSLLTRERYQWMIRADVSNAFNRSRLSGLNNNPANSLFGQFTNITGYRQVMLVTRFEF